jgi:hypothetical protein
LAGVLVPFEQVAKTGTAARMRAARATMQHLVLALTHPETLLLLQPGRRTLDFVHKPLSRVDHSRT